MRSSVREYRPAFFLICAAACWGVATAISKHAVAEIAPLALLPLQLAASVLVLAPLKSLTQLRGSGPLWTPMMRRLAVLGVLNPGISYALSLLGLARITASLSVLLWALEPVLILMLARGVLGDRLTRGRALAVTAALAGVVLIVWQGGAVGDAGGVALTVAGVGACAVYTVLCRKLLTDDAALPVVLVQQASALVFAVALYAVATPALATAPLGQISGRAWASAIVSGILYYAVAFCFYLAGLKQVAAGTAGVYLTLIPVFGVTAAYLLLGEELTRRQWLGAGIVLVAVVAVVLGVGQHAPRSEPVRPPR